MPRIRLKLDEGVRLFRALALMLASGLLFGYATGANGLDPPAWWTPLDGRAARAISRRR